MPIIFHKKIKLFPIHLKKKIIFQKRSQNIIYVLNFQLIQNHIISVIGTVNEQKRSIQALKTLEILREKGINAILYM